MQQEKSTNPIVAFQRVWRVVEKVTMTISVLVVVATVGYLSVHVLA